MTVPASISLNAMTVGLSPSQSRVGRLPPVASCLALLAASIINSYLVDTFSKQSSTVILAIFLPFGCGAQHSKANSLFNPAIDLKNHQ